MTTTKSSFGAGHSLTLCKAAANARLQKVHQRRMSLIKTSIDVSVPHSLHRKFDDSKGKLQKKINRKYQMREDKVTLARIKKMNARDPILGETLHDKLVGGSMHSPPTRALDVLQRNNKSRERKFLRSMHLLEEKNLKIAERIRQVAPTKVSRRDGTTGWNQHWEKHAHWQHTNIKRRNLMQKMVHQKLHVHTHSNERSPESVPPVPVPVPVPIQQQPTPLLPTSSLQVPTKKTMLRHELELHSQRMRRTLNMSPVLLDGRPKEIVNPTTLVQPTFQEYINRMGVAEQTVFHPHAPARRLLLPVHVHPGRKRREPTSTKGKTTKKNTANTSVHRRKHIKKMPARRTMTLSEEKLAKLDRAWAEKTKIQPNGSDKVFALPTYANVVEEMLELDCVIVSRWQQHVVVHPVLYQRTVATLQKTNWCTCHCFCFFCACC